MTLSWPPWASIPTLYPWQLALAAAVLAGALYLLARLQLERAKEDWANAFFYSPSQKTRARQRRQRWQDRCWALLGLTLLCLGLAIVLYVGGPR
jgi:hypothetical protein